MPHYISEEGLLSRAIHILRRLASSAQPQISLGDGGWSF